MVYCHSLIHAPMACTGLMSLGVSINGTCIQVCFIIIHELLHLHLLCVCVCVDWGGGQEAFLLNIQMNSEAYPATLSMGPCSFKGGGTWSWHDVDHFLVLCNFIAWTGTNFTYTIYLGVNSVRGLLMPKKVGMLLQ